MGQRYATRALRRKGAIRLNRGRARIILADIGILLVAFIWGATNVVIRGALSDITPFWFCALRFFAACIAVWALFGRRAARLSPTARLTGFLVGIVFICAYLVGAVALLYTTAGNQSFIISMSVAFVPLCIWIFTRRFPGWHILASVALCVAGMAGLMLGDAGEAAAALSPHAALGDALCFASMLFVTAYILLVQKFVRDTDAYALACWQALGGMLLAVACALLFEPVPASLSKTALLAVAYAGTIGFALTLVLQNVAQQYTSATHAAILLSTSGLFGSVLGVVFLDEPMTTRIFVSSALILAGVLAAELVPSLRKTQTENDA